MIPKTVSVLRSSLESNYRALRGRLARRVGSEELAEECLQETWIRLGNVEGEDDIDNPQTYILHIATNIARDKLRRERRKLSAAEIAQVLHHPDHVPDPETTAQMRADIEILQSAVSEMPERRKTIFVMARVHGWRYEDIAKHLGISTRTVAAELQLGLDYCASRLERDRHSPQAGRSRKRGEDER
jgi:RNA polymerase sigma factor (sigma-70 family)